MNTVCGPFTDHSTVFLTAANAGKSEIKAPADLVSARVHLLIQLLVFSLCLDIVEMIGGGSPGPL